MVEVVADLRCEWSRAAIGQRATSATTGHAPPSGSHLVAGTAWQSRSGVGGGWTVVLLLGVFRIFGELD